MAVTETREANAIERRIYYSHFPRKGSVATMQGHMGKHQAWSGGRGKSRTQPFLGFPWERQSRAE